MGFNGQGAPPPRQPHAPRGVFRLKVDNPEELAAVACAVAPRGKTASARKERTRLRLGDLLAAQGVLTTAQLTAALAEQRRSGRRLGRILIEDGIASEATIARAGAAT
jgi:hypothetical protein